MTLLHRIAISNGNKARKAAANLLIADMNRHIVEAWHKQLEVEILQKKARQEGYAGLSSRSSETSKESEAGELVRRRLESVAGPIRIEVNIRAAFRPAYGRLRLAVG